MSYPELRLLGQWTHTGTLAAGNAYSPAPKLTNAPSLPQGALNGKQVGEVARVVVFSPVSPVTGAADDLQYVQLVLDGKDYPYVWFSGRQDTSMAPPANRVRYGVPISLGRPFIENGKPNGITKATCPPFIDSVSFKAWAGASAVTNPFTVQIWGYVYDSVKLAGDVPEYVPANVEIQDPLNNRSFTVVAHPLAAAGDWRGAWKAKAGGTGQGVGNATPVFPLVRRARNAQATTVNQSYVPQYQNSSDTPAVPNPQDNMFFTPDARQALLLQRFGIVGPASPNATGYDLLSAWIQTPAESQQRHPEGGIPAGYNTTAQRFGLVRGETNLFDCLPFLPQGEQLVTNETAYPTFIDNGTSVPALDVMLGLQALLLGTDDSGI